MKGLLLAGGTGRRLRPLTHTQTKQLMPIANRPILFYALDAMVEAGVTDVAVIVDSDRNDVQDALGDGARHGARLTFISQDRPLGLAHAVRTARDYLANEAFLMFLGDNLLGGGLKTLVERFSAGTFAASILLSPVDDPRQFGVAIVDQTGVVQVVEKPPVPPSNLALVGAYCFTPMIHEAIEHLKPSWRGEYEITDAIQRLIDWNCTVDSSLVEGWWKDIGRPEDVLEANRLVLENVQTRIDGTLEDSQVSGHVACETGSRIIRSVIRGPVVVGANTLIEDSYVGPYTAIGPNVQISATEIEHSVVLADCCIQDIPHRIDQSLIGRGVQLHGGGTRRPGGLNLVLGDQSRIDV